MSGVPSFVDRVVEFYTLRRAWNAQERLGAARSEIVELAELGRQRGSAAEALFAVGHSVEALRLAVESVEALESAVARFAEASGAARVGTASPPTPAAEASAAPDPSAVAGEPGAGGEGGGEAGAQPAPEPETAPAPAAPSGATEPWRAALRAAASAAEAEATERTLARAAEADLPRLESGIAPAHAVLFRDLMRARKVLAAVVEPATLSRAEIRFTRGWRPLVTAVLVLGGAFGLFHALRPVEGTFVRVSATWADSPDFRSDFAIDGDESTMWLLPNGETGFLEVRFVPGRRIERIRLVNAGSARVPDRATREYTLEIWVDGAVVQSIDGEFADELAGIAEHDVGVDDVERIRFLVRSNHRVSAGLSELHWE